MIHRVRVSQSKYLKSDDSPMYPFIGERLKNTDKTVLFHKTYKARKMKFYGWYKELLDV